MFTEQFLESLNGTQRASDRSTDRSIKGKIIGSPKAGEEAFVHVPAFGENARRGPCKWNPIAHSPTPLTPEGGEECIVEFDSDGLPWITQWWPY
jgi:hypothetical protein